LLLATQDTEATRAVAFTAANEALARLTEEKASLTPEGIAAIRDVERRRAVLGRARAIDREIAQARVALSERHLAVIDGQIATAEGRRRDGLSLRS